MRSNDDHVQTTLPAISSIGRQRMKVSHIAIRYLSLAAENAESYVDIATRINARVEVEEPGIYYPLTARRIGAAITWQRKHKTEMGWTVQHGRRGRTVIGEKRFNIALSNPDGTFFDSGGDKTRHWQLQKGVNGSLAYAGTILGVVQFELEGAAQQTINPAISRILLIQAQDAGYYKIKMRNALEEIERILQAS